MIYLKNIKQPEGVDWGAWAVRWDRMQERYLPKRPERFEKICGLTGQTQNPGVRVLDLGCGTGSLMLAVLRAFPEAEVWGIDFNPVLMWIAEAQLKPFYTRARLVSADLRQDSWVENISDHFDAVISAAALHWLSASHIAALYYQLVQILKPGGLFLNADHVGNGSPVIQKGWEENRKKAFSEVQDGVDDWRSFWTGYSAALGLDTLEINNQIRAGYEQGVEEGLPLAWHFERLRECGFKYMDCFWRCNGDAIYGGIKPELFDGRVN